MHKILLCSAFGLATFAIAPAAFSADSTAARSLRVNYSDLNLASDSGLDHLYARLKGASRTVCSRSGPGAAEIHAERACATRALDTAVATVNDVRLSTLHGRAAPPPSLLAAAK